MSEQQDQPIGGEYQDKRKAGMPIPDFADEGFFEELPELRSLSRQQLETMMGLACYLHLVMAIPNPHQRDIPLTWLAELLNDACQIYAVKQSLERKHVMRLVLSILDWLRKNDWRFFSDHSAKARGGGFIFTTMEIKLMVVPDDGDSN
jgi:hypothetical protein